MKTPARLKPLLEDGIIDEVLTRLMSGKEADLFVVRCGTGQRCAKVYKEAAQRSFKQAVTYQEGRKVRGSRQARAMQKRTRYGRQQTEATWQTAEVEALQRLAGAGVRVPRPHCCVDGVLLMELIRDADGDVAPRLSDVEFSAEQARSDHAIMVQQIVRMLCAGIVHGDLSEFNVLQSAAGPVIIDLPQAVDAAANNSAAAMFERDVSNMTGFYGQFAPELNRTRYASEIWSHFESGTLTPDSVLTGHFEDDLTAPDVDAVLSEIESVAEEEAARLERLEEDEAAAS